MIYTVEGWVNKNRDELHQHIAELLSEISTNGASDNNSSSDADVLKYKSEKDMKYDTNCLMSELFPLSLVDGGNDKHNKATVGGKFLQQLSNLR